jgi:hypothetical protein
MHDGLVLFPRWYSLMNSPTDPRDPRLTAVASPTESFWRGQALGESNGVPVDLTYFAPGRRIKPSSANPIRGHMAWRMKKVAHLITLAARQKSQT